MTSQERRVQWWRRNSPLAREAKAEAKTIAMRSSSFYQVATKTRKPPKGRNESVVWLDSRYNPERNLPSNRSWNTTTEWYHHLWDKTYKPVR